MDADKIRESHPEWFRPETEARKKTLLAMPKGIPRPSGELGLALSRYTSPKSSSYDPVFAAAILKKQPQWSSKEEKPSDNTKLGQVLRAQFVGRARRSPEGISYDPNFAAKIRKRQPNWFRE